MSMGKTHSGVWVAAGMLVASLLVPGISRAQATMGPQSNTLSELNGTQANYQMNEANTRDNLGDPRAESAYQTFHRTEDTDKKIKLGQAFLGKYPANVRAEYVFDELAQLYYTKMDLTDFYANTDKGLARYPDDAALLAITGWVIPRVYKRDDPNADQSLVKAEAYENHALDLMKSMKKPGGVSDQQFDAYRNQELITVHSGLGMIYFRQEKYDESAKELQQATQNEANPDPTDFFVLGADLQNLHQFKEAADAFGRCAQIPGSYQDNCKLYADHATKLAEQAK